jgi:hypothetical protein
LGAAFRAGFLAVLPADLRAALRAGFALAFFVEALALPTDFFFPTAFGAAARFFLAAFLAFFFVAMGTTSVKS